MISQVSFIYKHCLLILGFGFGNEPLAFHNLVYYGNLLRTHLNHLHCLRCCSCILKVSPRRWTQICCGFSKIVTYMEFESNIKFDIIIYELLFIL